MASLLIRSLAQKDTPTPCANTPLQKPSNIAHLPVKLNSLLGSQFSEGGPRMAEDPEDMRAGNKQQGTVHVEVQIRPAAKMLSEIECKLKKLYKVQLVSSTLKGDIEVVLPLWVDAALTCGMHGPNTVPPLVWTKLINAACLVAPRMELAQISYFVRCLASAMHSCGPRVDPPPALFRALAQQARLQFKETDSEADLLHYQAALAELLHVAATAAARACRDETFTKGDRHLWAERIAANFMPLVAVGMTVVHRHAKATAKEAFTPAQDAQAALLFASALAPLACCPLQAPPPATLMRPGDAHEDNGPRWLRALRRTSSSVSPAGYEKSQSAAATSTCEQLDVLIRKTQARGLSVAEWLNVHMAPGVLRTLTQSQLDAFTDALQAAAGDEALYPHLSPVRLVLWQCATQALEEAAWRVKQPEGALSPAHSLDAHAARRIAAAGRRSWEAAALAGSPQVSDVADAVAALERFVYTKEEEEVQGTIAEMAAASLAAASAMELSSSSSDTSPVASD